MPRNICTTAVDSARFCSCFEPMRVAAWDTLSIRVVYAGGTTGAVAGSYVMLLSY